VAFATSPRSIPSYRFPGKFARAYDKSKLMD